MCNLFSYISIAFYICCIIKIVHFNKVLKYKKVMMLIDQKKYPLSIITYIYLLLPTLYIYISSQTNMQIIRMGQLIIFLKEFDIFNRRLGGWGEESIKY